MREFESVMLRRDWQTQAEFDASAQRQSAWLGWLLVAVVLGWVAWKAWEQQCRR